VDRPFDFSAPIATADRSYVLIDGNVVENTNEFIAQFENIKRVRFINNHCRNIGGDGIVVGVGAGCLTNNNYIEGYGSAGTHQTAVFVALGLPTVSISGNQIGSVGGPATSYQLDIRRKCIITDNHIVGSSTLYGICLYSYAHVVWDFAAGIECTVSGNLITGQISGIMVIRGDATVAYYNGSRITNNHFSGQTGSGVYVYDAMGVVVEGNEFGPMNGVATWVRGTAAGGSSTQIVGNKYTNVEARGVGSAIRIENLGSSGASGCLISGNHLEECGTQHNPSLVTSMGNFVIRTDADETSIVGNFIKHLTGGNNPLVLDDESIGIKVSVGTNRCLVQGNFITKDFSLAGHVAESFIGIRIASEECLCQGNMIDFRGTQASVYSAVVVGIYCESNNCALIGNMVRGSWARSAGSFTSSYAIKS
jgi:parallel beta-helix repeat protein